MCGIAGYFGKRQISNNKINECLKSLIQRGPDFQKKFKINYKNKKILLFHSRLSIIDLNQRSNQPFSKHGLKLVYNGEIYNFKIIKDKLVQLGYKFNTTSDTEVILSAYHKFGVNCFQMFKGMWALAIWDDKKKEIILSRDRFGEKPLYYSLLNKEFFFSSQIKQIQHLSKKKLTIDDKQIINFLALGYRSLNKFKFNFFKNIYKVPNASYIKFNGKKLIKKKYWKLNYNPNHNINESCIIKSVRRKVINAVNRITTSDVPISLMLSGGIDSNIISSVVQKVLKKKLHSFSIVDKDPRYNENLLIDHVIKKNNLKSTKYLIKKKKFFKFYNDLKKIVEYNSSPMLTITSYISNQLHRLINNKNIKVSITGIGADEIFAGYYDHGLYFLAEQVKSKKFNKHLFYWKKNIQKNIRNPHLKKYENFIKDKNYRKHLFFTNPEILRCIKIKKYSKFSEEKFCNDVLRNRMLNELFYETIPPILNEDDQNHMFSSVENRSPFLDVDLVEFMFTIPTKFLIYKGLGKSLLRKAFKDIVDKKILNNKLKQGFNASIDSIININADLFKNYFSNKKLLIYRYINYEEIEKLFTKKSFSNSESMFIFRFINCNIFLEKFSR